MQLDQPNSADLSRGGVVRAEPDGVPEGAHVRRKVDVVEEYQRARGGSGRHQRKLARDYFGRVDGVDESDVDRRSESIDGGHPVLERAVDEFEP